MVCVKKQSKLSEKKDPVFILAALMKYPERPEEIRSGHRPNTSQKHYHLSQATINVFLEELITSQC
jgi:hypothetical protein